MIHQMFNVTGMTCEACVAKITAALGADSRIRNLHVTLNPPRIHFDSDKSFDSEEVNGILAPLGKYTVSEISNHMGPAPEPFDIFKYTPLILLFGLSAGIPALNMAVNHSHMETWMYQFMGATLIALSYFKLADLPKFAEAFSTYDPVASRAFSYGYVYPFLELAAGTGFVLGFGVDALSVLVILILLPTTYGVIQALRANRKFQCACLGTAFNLPLTKVTIVENILMISMSAMIVMV